MLKVFQLILRPGAAWDQIARQRRGLAFILATYLLPMLLLGAAVEGWGLQRWGEWQPKFEKLKEFSGHTIITYEVIQGILWLLMVFVSALLLLKISQTFQSRRTYLEAFTTVAYGFSPLLLMRLLDAGPMISPWVTWGIGILLTIWILYQGIPRVLEPDPSHAFGLYFSAMFVMVLSSGVVRVLTALYLLGYVDLKHSWITHKFPNLFQ